MGMLTKWRSAAKALKQEVRALYLALRDPRTPWYAKALGVCVVAYAISPIDLIPDPIPIVGYLDDLIIVPLGILLLRRLIPPNVLADCRQQAAATAERSKALPWVGACIIVILWLAVLGCGGGLLWHHYHGPSR